MKKKALRSVFTQIRRKDAIPRTASSYPSTGGTRQPRTGKKKRWDCLIERLPKTDIQGAEVGVWGGKMSEPVLRALPRCRMFLVDRWEPPAATDSYYSSGSRMAREPRENYVEAYERMIQRTAPFGDRVQVIKDESSHAATTVSDLSLDFVFIDGDHSFPGATRDLIAWWPKVKLGGLIGGHDYNHPNQGGVAKAVNTFFGGPLVVEIDDDHTWWLVKSEALLRRWADSIPELGGGGRPNADPLIRYASLVSNGEVILDVGPWLGSQTAYLALGVLRSGRRVTIHSFDKWEIDEGLREKAKKYHGLDFEVGQDVEPVWRKNIERMGIRIVSHRGDVNGSTWDDTPIGLVVDDCGAVVNVEAMRVFAPHMRTGSRLILMDWNFKSRGYGDVFPWQREWMNKNVDAFRLIEEIGATAGVFERLGGDITF